MLFLNKCNIFKHFKNEDDKVKFHSNKTLKIDFIYLNKNGFNSNKIENYIMREFIFICIMIII